MGKTAASSEQEQDRLDTVGVESGVASAWWEWIKSDSTLCLAVGRIPLSWSGLWVCRSLMSRREREVLTGQPVHACVSGLCVWCVDTKDIHHSLVYVTHRSLMLARHPNATAVA